MPFLFFFYAFYFFFFLLQTPSVPAKTLPPIPTPSPAISIANTHNPWRGFSKFLDLQRGSTVPGIFQLKKYFIRFGYLSSDEVSDAGDAFDAAMESAVVSYQRNLGLPVTGKLDSTTLHQIMSPRCGLVDSIETAQFQATRKFAYFSGRPRWTKQAPITLTYAFSKGHTTRYLGSDEIRRAFRRAFSRWSAVIPVNFTEAAVYETADVKIGFFSGDHGDGQPFDGVLGILGHTFSPENGRLHMDAAETWAVDFERERSSVAVDLESVATHEIGHVLGLAHSSVKEAVMYPNLSPRTRKVELRVDDVEGVQALYGSNPNFKFSSLLASVTSSAGHIALDLTVRWTSWLAISTAVIGFLYFF